MKYQTLQTRRIARQYKKLQGNIAANVDAAVEKVAEDPAVGERKKGDLADLQVYKFRSQGQLYLLGYTIDSGVCLLYLEAPARTKIFTAI